MNSIVFTDDEARYLRFLMRHIEKPPDETRASWMSNVPSKEFEPVGEFNTLVIGAPGVGKTSLLEKVCLTGTLYNDLAGSTCDNLHQYIISLDSNHYKVDAVEFPVAALNSPNALEQLENAIAMTEAAVLVYDIANCSSLTYLKSLSNTLYEALHHTEALTIKKRTPFPFAPSRTTTTLSVSSRPYSILLLGAKSDVPDSQREVSWVEGQKAALEFFGPDGVAGGTSVHFMEASSLTGQNIDSIFPLLGHEILQARRQEQQRQAGLCQPKEQQASSSSPQRQQKSWPRRGGGGGGGGGFEVVFGGTSDILAGSMRRRWGALKTSLSVSLFKKDMK